MRRRSRLVRLVRWALLLALLTFAGGAAAHVLGLSTGEYTMHRWGVGVKLSFARAEVARLVPKIDESSDGHLTAREVEDGRALLEERLLRRIVVRRGGQTCPASLTDAALSEEDGLFVQGKFECPAGAGGTDVDVALLSDLSEDHRHVARVVAGGAIHDEVLTREHHAFVAPSVRASEGAQVEPEPAPSGAAHSTSAWSFLRLGVAHILTGYDHLVFLLALVLARGSLRSFVGVITSFTLAHSVTLAVAALGIWTPSPRIVEPAIALSIVYVGVENFFVRDVRDRWRVALPFGLVHGFGFAAALRELSVPRAEIPITLFSFNAGVEVGQLVVMAVVLPIIGALRRYEWFDPRGVRVLSGAVIAAGGVWFLTRIALG